jgi:hypothetical protein
MIRTLIVALIGLGLVRSPKLLVADFSTAGQTDPPKAAEVRQEPLAKFDKNVVKNEVAKAKKKNAKADNGQQAAEAILKKYDTNGDGKLDATELAAMIKDLHAKRESKKKAAT